MKPDWKDAPEWANWLTQDEDGAWVFHQNEPVADRKERIWSSDGIWEGAFFEYRQWSRSKEKRP